MTSTYFVSVPRGRAFSNIDDFSNGLNAPTVTAYGDG
jgi:hypothetical protein